MRLLSILLISTLLFSCNSKAQDKKEMKDFAINKTEAEWKTKLTENEFYILREAGTERPFTSNLLENKKTGTYVCAACETPLFESGTKFDSGTGWPSFYQEIEGNVAFDTDYNLGYARTEEVCATCGGHLGHVFKDGPDPTGERHCINGGALNFIPKSNE
jgi:peptide-methionine (R)-S-oxide reductase